MSGPPLKVRNYSDYFSKNKLNNELEDFELDYRFTGKRIGKSGEIELFVITSVVDAKDNMFVRTCEYSGNKSGWKDAIKEQLSNLLSKIQVSKGFIDSKLRYLEITPENYLEPEKFETFLGGLKYKLEIKKGES
ncbi:hypothetical protein G3I01_03930 [Gramella sp. MT6]|uniref:hypothetical protein n=1 Tax=Gramella sp. MT6 TaxID=2705471 RepID=UPI001C5D3F97|nr:hypothetical protein [Gramella sp. MT6]QYA24690.1 hypothetical protein G3I01_03930 [Gramella sp. MT6]